MTLPATGTSPLDSIVLVATPENVAFDFRLAGPFTRSLAVFVDMSLIAAVVIGMAIPLAILGQAGVGLLLFVAFVIWWGYGGLMEAFWNGQTLGKRALGIRVVSGSGLAINASQAMLRNILRSADLFPPFFPGVVAMLFGTRFQRLGDLAAGTMVILEGHRSSPRPPRASSVTDRMRQRIPTGFRPDAALVECLAAYVGRRFDLSTPRKMELSQILARHFIRAWSLPPKINADQLLCAIYEYATMDREPLGNQRGVFEEDYEDRDQREEDIVMGHLRHLEDISRESR